MGEANCKAAQIVKRVASPRSKGAEYSVSKLQNDKGTTLKKVTHKRKSSWEKFLSYLQGSKQKEIRSTKPKFTFKCKTERKLSFVEEPDVFNYYPNQTVEAFAHSVSKKKEKVKKGDRLFLRAS